MNKSLTKELNSFISEIADKLIENNPEEYEKDKTDYGHYHNGVGFACCGYEIEYDENKAFIDAKEKLIEDIQIYSSKQKRGLNGYLDELLEKVPSLRKILTQLIERA